ncbi:MAG: hypothetical protein J6W00_03070 [Lentisphaeria bacterium]|nr:hypothetical protein [Lentisphaeria bacterium]
MKKFIALFVFAFIFGGCVSVDNNDISPDEQMLAKEQKMGEEMIEAFRKRDLAAFIQYIPAGGRQMYGKNEFQKEQQEIAARMGEIVSYRFLTKLEMEPAHQLVWAVRFKSYSLKGEPIYREALFTIVVGEVDDSRKVFLFGFK